MRTWIRAVNPCVQVVLAVPFYFFLLQEGLPFVLANCTGATATDYITALRPVGKHNYKTNSKYYY